MKSTIISILLTIVFSLYNGNIMAASTHNNTKTKRLFYIERSVDKSLVCYDIDSDVDLKGDKRPINVYWLDLDKNIGDTFPITNFQFSMAYGYNIHFRDQNTLTITLTAYKDRVITVTQTKENCGFNATIAINNKECILDHIFVKTSPKNPLKVEYVKIIGLDPTTSRIETEIIYR